jgi:hypothetical protein
MLCASKSCVRRALLTFILRVALAVHRFSSSVIHAFPEVYYMLRLFPFLFSVLSLSFTSVHAAPHLMFDGTVDDRVVITPVEERVIYNLATHAAALNAWKDQQQCTGGDFRVTGNAHGSFTRKDSSQNVYLYEYCQPGMARDEGLVIIENGRIIAHDTFQQNVSGLYALKDINRNGLSELLMAGVSSGAGGMMDGYLGSLPYFYEECGAVDDSHLNYDVRLYVTPGPRPTFEVQKIFRACQVAHGTTVGARAPVKLDTSTFRPEVAFTSSTLVPAKGDTKTGLSGLLDSTASVLDTEICHKYGCTGVKHITGPKAGADDRVDVAFNTYYAVRYSLRGGGTVETRWSSEDSSSITGYLELKLPLGAKLSQRIQVVQAFLQSGLGDKIAAHILPSKILNACTLQKDPIYASNPEGFGVFALCEHTPGQYTVKIVVGE